MTETVKDGAPLDEGAVLDELERLRENIERQRARRREIGDAFEQFVREVRGTTRAEARARTRAGQANDSPPAGTPSHPVGIRAQGPAEDPTLAEWTSERDSAPAERPGTDGRAAILDFQPEAPAAAPRRSAATSPTASRDPGSSSSAATSPSASKSRILTGTLLMVAIGTLAALSLFGGWSSSPAPAASSSAPLAPPEPASRAEPERPTLPPAPESALTTTRLVWVRVVADGETVLERELQPGRQVPITAKQTILIRTGDAGAVRLTIGGRDIGVMGRDGEVLTRRYEVDAPARR